MAALQASGAISFQNIEEHYNPGSNLPSRGLSEFYFGGSLVRDNASNNSSTNMSAGVPSSGNPISLNDFYGKERAFKKTFSDGNTNQSADTIFGDDFEVDYPKQLVISSGHTIGSTSTSNAALTIESNGVGSITITNEGSIEGAGGAAGGGAAWRAATRLLRPAGGVRPPRAGGRPPAAARGGALTRQTAVRGPRRDDGGARGSRAALHRSCARGLGDGVPRFRSRLAPARPCLAPRECRTRQHRH